MSKGENGKAGFGEGGLCRTASVVTSPGRNSRVPPDVDGQPTIRERAQPTSQEHPDEKVLWFREGQFDASEILSGEACTVSLRDPPGSIKLLHEWSLSPDFPKLAGFMIGDESRFRRILGVSKDGDNVIYKVGRCARVDGQPTIKKAAA